MESHLTNSVQSLVHVDDDYRSVRIAAATVHRWTMGYTELYDNDKLPVNTDVTRRVDVGTPPPDDAAANCNLSKIDSIQN